MKKVLITGANSYVGTSVEKWLNQTPEKYQVTTIDVKGETWKKADFTSFDTIFHVAGLAHSDTGNVSEETKQLYYKVNTDLTVEVAKKAKKDGVEQFIFMSSMIVYGDSAGINERKVITKDTPTNPANFYGDSKVQAELGIQPLADENFKVVIVRPPMIYGKGSKGNYPVLAKAAKKLPIFPDIENERSMLYIGNLCEFIRLMIENGENGVFFPQNKEYVKTSELVRMIGEVHNHRVRLVKVFNPIVSVLAKRVGVVNKVFGNLSYEQSVSEYKENYCLFHLQETIRKTEG